MSALKLLLMSLVAATGMRFEAAHMPAPKPKQQLALRLRGGADASQLAKYAVYFTSGFMFIPAGRDVISPGAEIMPDDDKLIGKMFTDTTKDGYTFMWNAWGVNWIILSIMKMVAVSTGSSDFLKLGFVHDVVAMALMAKEWIPEFKPFALLFGLETIALGKLAFA